MNITETDLCLRKIKEEDISAIVKIEEELFPDPWGAGMFRDSLRQDRDFFKYVGGEKKESRHSYVLEYKGEVIGFFFGWAICDEYTIMNIGVSKRHQGKGLGAYLLQHILAKAQELHCFTIYLEARISNISAINLYKKFNFEKIGIRKNYYQVPVEDAIIMSLDFLKRDDREKKA